MTDAAPDTGTPAVDVYAIPHYVDDATLAFPARVVGTLMPDREDLPEEFREYEAGSHVWRNIADLMFAGKPLDECDLTVNDGIDAEDARRHVLACLRSHEPTHQHKIASVAYLLSRWYHPTEVAAS